MMTILMSREKEIGSWLNPNTCPSEVKGKITVTITTKRVAMNRASTGSRNAKDNPVAQTRMRIIGRLN